MRTRAVLAACVAVLAGVAGIAGAVAGFQLITDSGGPRPVTATEVQAGSGAHGRARVEVRFRPCPKGFAREGRACVRTVERTVVLHQAGAPTSSGTPAQVVAPSTVRSSGRTSTSGDHGPLHDLGDDHGDDHGGDRHGDDDGDHSGHGGGGDDDDD